MCIHQDQKTNAYCAFCGYGILEGEEYVENQDGEYIHFECIRGIRQLLEWLGYQVKERQDFEYYKD